MKKPTLFRPFLLKPHLLGKVTVSGACLLSTLAARTAHAQQGWDPNGTTSIGGNAIWDTTTKNWTPNGTQTQVTSGSLVAFTPGNTALFCAGPSGSANQGTFYVTNNTANLIIGAIVNGDDNPGPCTVNIVGTGSLNLPAATVPIVTYNSTLGYTYIDIPINGTGPLEGQSIGSLILNAANTYTGGFEIDGTGGVTFGNNAAFGTGTITWLTGGFLQPAGNGAYNITNAMTHLAITETFSGSSGGVTFSGPWTLPASTTANVTLGNIANTITVSGAIGGGAGLIINHASTGWLFTGVNTFNNNMAITAGTLTIGGSGELNSGSYAGRITNAGAFVYSSSASQTLSGVISGAGTLTQSSGTLILSGANTYTGNTTLSGGVVQCAKAESVNASGPFGKQGQYATGTILMNGGTIQYTSSNQHDYSARFGTSASQFYYVDVNGQSVSYSNALVSANGVLTVSSSTPGGTLTLGGVNTYAGISTVNAGATLNVTNDFNLGAAPASYSANQLTLNGGTLGLTVTAADLSGNRGIYLAANSAISASTSQSPSIEGTISGPGMLIKTNAGNLNLNGSNTFSGGLTILNGGVRFNTNSAAGTGTITVTPSAVVTLRSITPPALTLVTLTNPVFLSANAFDVDLTAASGDTFNLAGPISGPGYLTRGRASGGGGIVGLSGSNTFSGGLILEGGTLALGSSNALGTGTLTVLPGANQAAVLMSTIPLTGANAITNPVNVQIANTFNLVIGGVNNLELAGPIVLSNATSLMVTITNTNSGASIISGVISSLVTGTGLTVAGSGTLTLSAANTYNGNTAITGGTLALASSGSISASPLLSIGAGGIFDVSSQATYSLPALSASGSAAPAVINGASGGMVSAGSQRITLAFDGSDPALNIAQGTLVLNNNAFTVNSGSPLTAGTYVLIQQASGNISDLSGTYPAPTGTAIAPGGTGVISVSGSTVLLTIYPPPVPGSFSLGAVEGVPTSVAVSKILSTATSPNPNPMFSIVSVTSPTTNGATVTLGGGMLTYTSANNLNPDTINYVLSDGYATAPGTIAVMVSPNGPGTNELTATSSGGNLTIQAYGIPGVTYYIQQSTNSPGLPPWMDVATNVANSLGQISATLYGPLPSPSYYRTSTNP